MKRALLLMVVAAFARAESGTFTIHMILHAIGEEKWDLTNNVLTTTTEQSDRGNKRTTTATLKLDAKYAPLSFERGANAPPSETPLDYTGMHSTSFGVQTAMMRYWFANGKPKSLPAHGAATDQPIRIEPVGHEIVSINGRKTALDRYTIANLMFGREILWMDAQHNIAAAMTFAGGLPIEAIRTEYLSALDVLYRSGVAQEMADLKQLAKAAGPEPEPSNAFAIVGATLIDGTGGPPIKNSEVVVADGRIVSAGQPVAAYPPGQFSRPGMKVIHAEGKTLLPGLWEMHIHFSGVEFGPALLASGITTARDCGGEFDYLVAQRNASEKRGALSPRLLLAGLVDAGGLKAFGHVTAETPEEGRAVVKRYHDVGFQQIKLYTFLQPDVVRAIADEAHRNGMTVTGHVPQVFNAFQGVEAGMDQINHLNYVSNMMRSSRTDPVDVNSPEAKAAVAFFREHHTVVDPTAGWGEMSGHSKEVDVATFEPGILKAPYILDAKFRGMGGATTADQMHSRMAQTLAVIGALHKGGVTIVPGSDTGLVGGGLHREIELYVQAGMTPMEAIQSATIVSARAMNLDKDSGTIEIGKRADMILIDGDPLADIKNLRNVRTVIEHGMIFDAAKLAASVGFRQ